MKNELVKAIQNKNIRDYTYAIMFFIVASFFAFFVIKPVLGIAISIRREGEDLKRVNEVYEDNITRVLELQSQIEEVRSKKYLLDEALPSQPQIQDIIADIQRAADQSHVIVTSVQIDPLALKESKDPKKKSKLSRKISAKKSKETIVAEEIGTRTVGARIHVEASFEGMGAFLQALVNQRRIKRINGVNMTLVKGKKDAAEVIQLNVQLELNGYYVADKVVSQ